MSRFNGHAPRGAAACGLLLLAVIGVAGCERADRAGATPGRLIIDPDRADAADEGSALAHFARGNEFLANQEFDHAVAEYTEAIRLEPVGGMG